MSFEHLSNHDIRHEAHKLEREGGVIDSKLAAEMARRGIHGAEYTQTPENTENLSHGVWDASQDEYVNPSHDDERWIVRSED